MKKKVIPIIITVIFVILALGIYAYKKYDVNATAGVINPLNDEKYDATYETRSAVKKYDINKKAKVIKDVDTQSNIVALTFEGINNNEAAEEALDLLDLYDVKATFFISGIEAAENPGIVEMIKEAGHDIGSGTLSGTTDMQNLSKEELMSDFSSANKVLKEITKKNTRLLKSSSTVYSNELLASAYATGNKYVVSPDYYISYQSFKDYEQVNGYIKRLSKGNIISIKLDGALDEFEYEMSKAEEKPVEENPAVENQAEEDQSEEEDQGIDEQDANDENEIDDYGYEVTIVEIMEWLLESITEQGVTPVQVKKLPILDKQIDANDEEEVEKPNSSYIINNNVRSNGIISNDIKKVNNEQNKVEEKEEEVNFPEINLNELIANNKGQLAPIVSRFLTTQEALTYTFRGLSNEKVLDNVLASLNKYNAKGTFFVTKDEINSYPDRIEKIIKAGHEIANGGVTNTSKILSKTTEDIAKEIYGVDKLLKEKGISTNSYMAGYGHLNSNIQEAVSTIKQINGLGNYELINYTKSPIMEKYKDMNASDIVSDYFDVNSYFSLSKGEIVYFRLDSDIFKDNNTISNIIEILTDKYVKNGYANQYSRKSESYNLVQMPLNYNVVPIKDIQNTIEGLGNYGRYSLVSDFKKLEKVSRDKVPNLIKSNFIGHVNAPLYGFNNDEIASIDNTGIINTNGENVVFLTFDDWGGDPIVNQITGVLDKHNVKGSFFIVGKYTDVDNTEINNINPNLLRTIALNGHDIAGHGYNHELLSVGKNELDWSLTETYNAMAKIIGDLDTLTKYYRPPTLYVNKDGVSSVFENGHTYSISGNISTHDYEANSSDEILYTIESQLVEGAGNVIVMHMNDQSYYTAEAVDKFLTNNENGVYGKKYKVAKLSDYLAK